MGFSEAENVSQPLPLTPAFSAYSSARVCVCVGATGIELPATLPQRHFTSKRKP